MSFISGETKSFGLGYMLLRGDLKVGRLERGDLLLRAKGHFKGGPKTVDETMLCLLGVGCPYDTTAFRCLLQAVTSYTMQFEFFS